MFVAFDILYKHSNGCDGSRCAFLSSSLQDYLWKNNGKLELMDLWSIPVLVPVLNSPICERIKMTNAFEQQSVP